jgi:hypothetical protein
MIPSIGSAKLLAVDDRVLDIVLRRQAGLTSVLVLDPDLERGIGTEVDAEEVTKIE